MVKIALFGVVVMLLALPFRTVKQEYSLYIGLAGALMVFGWVLGKLGQFVTIVGKLREWMPLEGDYITVLIKMAGISYITEFSMDVCKDAGCHTLAGQIGIAGKVTMMGLSVPVLFQLIDKIVNFG